MHEQADAVVATGSSGRAPFVALAALVLTFIAIQTTWGRLPQSADEVWYKAAGREWAASGHFAAPELINVFRLNLGVEKIFFLFVPLYSFLFGLFVKAVGFGWRACMFYDALITGVLAVSTFLLTDRVTERKARWLAVVAAAAMIPLTTTGRPDALATCLGISAVLLIGRQPGMSRLILGGVALGLCAGASPPAAIIFSVIGLNCFVWQDAPWTVRLSRATLWGLVALVQFALVLAPILVLHPWSLQQFFANSRGNVVSGARVQPQLAILLDLVGIVDDPSDRLLKLFVKGSLLVAIVDGACGLVAGRGRSWLEYWLGPFVAFCLLLTILAHNPLYYRILAPLCLAGALPLVVRPGGPRAARATACLSLVLGASWLASSYPFWRDSFVLLILPAEQQPAFQARYLPRVVPAGSRVFAHDAWFFLAGTCHVVDAWWAHPDMDAIDYAVFATGEATWRPPARNQYDAGDAWCENFIVSGYVHDPELTDLCTTFRVIEDNTNHQVYQFLGRPIFRKQKGFGCLVLKPIGQPSVSPRGGPGQSGETVFRGSPGAVMTDDRGESSERTQ